MMACDKTASGSVALALLVSDGARGLAGGLAGSLALTAAALLCSCSQLCLIDGLDMLHGIPSNHA